MLKNPTLSYSLGDLDSYKFWVDPEQKRALQQFQAAVGASLLIGSYDPWT